MPALKSGRPQEAAWFDRACRVSAVQQTAGFQARNAM
jgi:hypothetical protein